MLCTYRLYLFNMYCTTMYFDHINRMNICFKFVFLSSHSIVLTFQWSNRRIIRIIFVSLLTAQDCSVLEWTEWSECDNPCGYGTRRRTRSVASYPENGGKHCPALKQRRACVGFDEVFCTQLNVEHQAEEMQGQGRCHPFFFFTKMIFFLNLKFKMCVPSIFYHECTGLRHLWICSVWHTK